jgi:hypothetical protein
VQPGSSSSCEERKQAGSGLCAWRPSEQASLKQLFSRGKKLKHKIKIENKFINEKKMQSVVIIP